MDSIWAVRLTRPSPHPPVQHAILIARGELAAESLRDGPPPGHVQQSPDRQPRRHRLPHPPHPAPARWARSWPSTPKPTPPRAHVQADEAVCLGQGPAAALPGRRQDPRRRPRTGAQAIHPGYGFLSENAAFAEACEAAGIAFIGPPPEQMRDFGLKHRARALAATARRAHAGRHRAAGRPPRPRARRRSIGYPVMLKSTAGGGGIGMRVCERRGTARGLRQGPSAWAQRQLQRRRRVPREVRPARPPPRSAGVRRRQGALWWRWASATARCSGATRR